MNRAGRVQVTSPECALAAELFDHFCMAATMKQILAIHRQLCNTLNLKPTRIPDFYPKLKEKLASSWKAQALFKKFDARANNKVYGKGKACPQTKVLIIGAGPCGMRAAIECQLLGAKVVVIEKRDRLSRNNVLHLWPFVIHDLRALGAKKFFGKFCAGSIDHISIRQLQCILMKVALLLGIEFHEGVSFEDLLEPTITDTNEKLGWRARVTPQDHPVAQYEFDVLVGADGKRNTLKGFKRKEFRGKLAIAITANFINKHSEQEASVQEISGVAYIFNQKFFKELHSETGIDLENIVYYKDDTHYFVMTAKKHSLIEKGVILKDYAETTKLLSQDNVDRNAMMAYARQAAHFSTDGLLSDMQFALNHYGHPDVAMFDFTSMFAAENASMVVEVRGQRLLGCLVGDSLLEPFWPTGSGCARGFLSALDACWAVRSWGAGRHPLAVIAERESIYRLLGQTTPENLNRDIASYTLEPSSRYPNLNRTAVAPHQVTTFYNTDDPNAKSQAAIKAIDQSIISSTPITSKKRKRDSHVHADTLLHWLRKQVAPFANITVENLSHSMRSGQVLCAIIHRYRPDLIDIDSLKTEDVQENNQLAFDILERELGIAPVMTGIQMAESEVPDEVKMMMYLSNIYDTFKGEIPHVKHPHYDLPALEKKHHSRIPIDHSLANYSGKIAAAAEKRNESLKKNRKKRSYHSGRYNAPSTEERVKKLQEFANRSSEKHGKRQQHRNVSKEQFCKSVRMLHFNARREFNTDPFDDYSLYVYRQQAPQFDDRVKELEKKLTHLERDRSTPMKGSGRMEDSIHSKIKSVDELLRGGASMSDKKPKDLLRAIGKIESSDWNVKEIEKKIKENRLGKSPAHGREKVPKWNRDQFLARQTKLERHGVERQESCEGKFREIDTTLKRLDRKIKEGSVLEVGTRGKNKVANLLDQFVKKTEAESEKTSAPVEQGPPLVKSNSKYSLNLNNKTQLCRVCTKPVYVVERLRAEGFTFHKACFKCHYCATTLRVGNYSYDRNGQYGNNFFCTQHFGIMCKSGKAVRDQYEVGVPHPVTEIAGPDLLDRGETPERIGLENVVGNPTESGRAGIGAEEEDGAEMDEDEWTDRNFGASELSSNGLLSGGGDDCSSDEEFSQALEKVDSDGDKENSENESEVDSDSENEYDSDESDSFSYDEYSTGDETSEASGSDGGVPSYGTERSVERAARELRRQEVPPAPLRTPTTTDTEVGSEEETSKTSEVANSATEVSTDSEFAHDDPTPTRELPYITINDENVTKTRGSNFHRNKQAHAKKDFGTQEKLANNKKTENAPFSLVKVKVTSGTNNNVASVVKPTIEIVKKPLLEPVRPAPVRPSEFLLCRTQSTSGIATKRALELKKKYLLGNPSPLSIQKSDSASQLDSKFKSFQSNISECQKLLNATTETSPCMQAFLASASKRNYPTSPTSCTPVGLDFKKTKSTDDINCNKKDVPMPDIIQNLCKRPEVNDVYHKISDHIAICAEKKGFLDLTKHNDEANNSVPDESNAIVDEIVKTPPAETNIFVPQRVWNKTDEIDQHSRTATDIDSDSLSELDTSSGAVEKKISHASSTTSLPVPRVEIHNTSGELMQMDSLMIVDGTYVGPIDSDDDCINKLVNDSPPFGEVKENTQIVNRTEEVTEPPIISSNNSSESTNDVTTLAHTETELSDWANDGAMGETEHYDAAEYKLGVTHKNLHRLKNPKNIHKSKLLGDAANTENQQHVCGKNTIPVEVQTQTPYMKAVEEFDFMDMGSQDSLIDVFATTDNALMKNRGFMEIVDIGGDDKVSSEHNIDCRNLHSPVNDRSMNFIEQSACVINNPEVLSTEIEATGSAFVLSSIDKYDMSKNNSEVHQEKVIKHLSVELKNDSFYGPSYNDNNSEYVVEMESVSPLTTTTETSAATGVLETDIRAEGQDQNNSNDNVAVEKEKDTNNLSDYKTEDVVADIGNINNYVNTSVHNKLDNKSHCQILHSNTIVNVEQLGNKGIQFVIPSITRAKSFVQMEADACTSKKVREIMKEKDKQKDLVRDLVLDRLSASRPERRSTKRIRNSPEVNKFYAVDFITEREVLERQEPRTADSKQRPQVIGNNDNTSAKGNLKVRLNRSHSSQNKSTSPIIVKTNDISPLKSPRKSMELPFETTFIALKDDSGSPSPQLKMPFEFQSTVMTTNSSGPIRSRTTSDVVEASLSDSRLFSTSPAEHRNSTDSSLLSGELKRLTLNQAIASKDVSSSKREKQGAEENKRTQMKVTSMSDPNLSDFIRTERKGKSKDKERRKSIIQTVSNFFNKRLTPKSKESSKLGSCSDYDTPKKCHSEWSIRAASEAVDLEPESPPPVPPLPLNYELPSTTSSDTVLLNRRSSLSDSSAQLAVSEARTRLLEREVAELEDKLRKSEHSDQSVVGLAKGAGGDAETLGRWFDARRRLAAARHEWRTRAGREADVRLAERHARLLRRLRRAELSAAEESAVVGEMMQISAQRESLTAMREQDKTRIQQFDESTLDPQLLAALTKRKN